MCKLFDNSLVKVRLFLFLDNYFMSLRNKTFFGIFYLVYSVITGCSNRNTELTATQDSIMFINASPDAAAINITFNNETISPNAIIYTQNTSYGLINSGTKQVVTTQPLNNIQLLSLPLLLKNSKVYSVFFAGQISTGKLVYVATEDDLNLPDKSKSKYRFINVSENSKTLDFKLVGNTNDSVLVANIPFGSASNFTEIKPGNYNFKIISRDTTVKDNANLKYTLTKGKIYTFWAKGLAEGLGNRALGIHTIINNINSKLYF